jgi:hypothetical protein
MLVKTALLFLLAMVLVALIGRALFPGTVRRVMSRRAPGTCPSCGRHQIGRGDCPCGAKRKA